MNDKTEEIKHTPGPWRIERPSNDIEIVSGKYHIAYAGTCVNFSESEALKNGALISAAPELLAALQALCAWHDHEALTGLPYGDPVAAWAPSFDDTVKMIHAAIAKATGGTL